MKKHYFLLCLFAILCCSKVSAQVVGDTTWVNTFNYAMPNPPGGYGGGDQYKGSFQFPDGTEQYQKVLMYYSLKCDAATNQDAYPCGEWDYLSYTHLIDSTGLYDSTRRTQVNFIAKGATPNSLPYTNTPTYNTYNSWQYNLNVSSTLSLTTAQVGTGTTTSDYPLGTSDNSRSQYIWTAAELSAAGLTAGNITALRLNLTEGANSLTNLSIKLKATTQNNFDASVLPLNGFTKVYELNTSLTGSGWHTFYFTTPFVWDGTSNVCADFSYNSQTDGLPIVVQTTASINSTGIHSGSNDGYLEFHDGDYIEVPATGMGNITNEVTVMFWSYGDPDELPTQTYAFEAVDNQNRRVLNVHHPWSDGTVYWDAGNGGTSGYDRIQKSATGIYEGSWHHWAFVKNATTGSMQIYLDGVLWHSGAGKVLSMAGITKFRIARGLNEAWMHYHGFLDEFAVFNKALNAATIADWKDKQLNASHPNYSNLLLYYPFNEAGQPLTVTDQSGNNYNGTMMGYPSRHTRSAADAVFDFNALNERPNTIFEQGTYTATLDSTLVTEQIQNAPISVILYQNPANNNIIADNAPNHPSIPTDTISVWNAGVYTYTYTNGIKTDSSLVATANTITRNDLVYYSPVVRFEIGRFITPYGIQLDLGANGFTWIYDVTDYAPILRGTKHLRSGNAQELHDLRFAFIKGIPPRNVTGIHNLWNGEFNYSDIQNNITCTPLELQLPAGSQTARLKMRTTGHGGEPYENCGEFCFKNHQIKVNGTTRFSQLLKRECADNPVYPQGGTWIYDRAGWCPGDVVPTFDVELTPYITPTSPFTVDYAISNSAQPQGRWVIETQLVSYGAPNFNNDVAIDDIISPSQTQYHSRRNPICDGPVVRIKNTGANLLTSCTIYYGVEDGLGFGTFPACYTWFGSLDFMESEEVKLPPMNWANYDTSNPVFFVEVAAPNSQADEYGGNNRATSRFVSPPRYNSGLVFNFKGNNRSLYQNSYTLKDMYGVTVEQRATISNNATYNDTFVLEPGCYTLEFLDNEETNGNGNNGLSWWAASGDGVGFAKLKSPTGTVYTTFDPDFGARIYHQFLIGYDLQNMPYNAELACEPVGVSTPQGANGVVSVYPSPTNGNAFVELNFTLPQTVFVRVYDVTGKTISEHTLNNISYQKLPITLPDATGLYYISVTTPTQTFTRTVVKTN